MQFAILLCVVLLTACATGQKEFPFAPISAQIQNRIDGPTQAEIDQPTRVVVLGTGTPIPDAYRAGPSIAVIHHGRAYLFDVGAGSVRNAVRARYKYDIPSLYPSEIAGVFITHLHSDHILDYAELTHSLWWYKEKPLLAFGPEGLKAMTDGVYALMKPDLLIRGAGSQPLLHPEGYKVQVTEITDGVVFEHDGMRVEAFSVPHGAIRPAFGYRVTTPTLKIVISGDTSYSEKVLEMSRGADYLFHEVISDAGLISRAEVWQKYHKASHTPASQIGRLAAAADVKSVVLYHGLYYGTEEPLVVDEVRANFKGKVILASDLDLFE